MLSSYQKPYSKALGNDGVLVCHNNNEYHNKATEKADLFILNFITPSSIIDSQLLKQQEQQASTNREILHQIIYSVEFLAKEGVAFQGHRDNKVDYSDTSINRGNFIATLQLLSKSNTTLENHLLTCRYTSKTIQNVVIHIYACKLREKLTSQLQLNNMPFTIIADEVTDTYSNQEVLSVCVQFVDLYNHLK